MVFQSYAIFPHMTVYDNVAFGLKMNKFEKKEIEKRVRDASGLLHIEDMLERYPSKMSGGQRQRVAVARALAADPEVLVCDEITSALDARTAQAIMRALDETVRATGLSVVLISHDIDEVRAHADFVYVLDGGRALDSGPTSVVLPAHSTEEVGQLVEYRPRTAIDAPVVETK
jgi:multiple sugar transport system ATP-binding protein